jgi:hypothetical protein
MQPDAYYYNCINLPEYDDLRTAFGLDNSLESYKKYVTKYSSRVNHRPYNQALGFIHSQTNPDAVALFPTPTRSAALSEVQIMMQPIRLPACSPEFTLKS